MQRNRKTFDFIDRNPFTSQIFFFSISGFINEEKVFNMAQTFTNLQKDTECSAVKSKDIMLMAKFHLLQMAYFPFITVQLF